MHPQNPQKMNYGITIPVETHGNTCMAKMALLWFDTERSSMPTCS